MDLILKMIRGLHVSHEHADAYIHTYIYILLIFVMANADYFFLVWRNTGKVIGEVYPETLW